MFIGPINNKTTQVPKSKTGIKKIEPIHKIKKVKKESTNKLDVKA